MRIANTDREEQTPARRLCHSSISLTNEEKKIIKNERALPHHDKAREGEMKLKCQEYGLALHLLCSAVSCSSPTHLASMRPEDAAD